MIQNDYKQYIEFGDQNMKSNLIVAYYTKLYGISLYRKILESARNSPEFQQMQNIGLQWIKEQNDIKQRNQQLFSNREENLLVFKNSILQRLKDADKRDQMVGEVSQELKSEYYQCSMLFNVLTLQGPLTQELQAKCKECFQLFVLQETLSLNKFQEQYVKLNTQNQQKLVNNQQQNEKNGCTQLNQNALKLAQQMVQKKMEVKKLLEGSIGEFESKKYDNAQKNLERALNLLQDLKGS